MFHVLHGGKVYAELRDYRLIGPSHNYLLPLISRCLPLADEICSRSLNFINACLRNNSRLVRNVAHYGIQFGRYNSRIGHNALFCSRRFNFSFQDVSGENVSVRRCVYNYVNGLIQNRQIQTASFVCELLNLRDGVLELSNNVVLTYDELEQIVKVSCTC
jgi:hypothetical protein